MAFSLSLKRDHILLKRASPVSWALADQTMVSAANFLTGVLLARFLGIEEFGRFILVWLVAEILNNIQYSMISSPMMSVGPKQSDDDVASYLGALITQQTVFAVSLFALMIACGHIANSLIPTWDIGELAIAFAFAVVAFQVQDFVRRYLFMRGRAFAAFACDVVRYPGQIVILLLMVRQDGFDTNGVLWIIAGSGAVAALVGFSFVERPTLDRAKVMSIATRHWHLAKWLTSSAILRWLIVAVSNFALGALIGTAAVGGIRAVQSLLGLTHIILMGVENVIPGQAARSLSERGRAAMVAYLWRFGKISGLVMLVILATIAVAPDLWLVLAYGPEFSGQGYIVRWFAVLYFVSFLTVPPTIGLRALEQGRGIFLADLSAAGFSIIFFYPLVALLGVPGVMIGYSVTGGLRLVFLFAAIKKNLRQPMT